jgi:hypothetical protein
MPIDEKSPPVIVMSERTSSHTNKGRTDPVRVLNISLKSDESPENDDGRGGASQCDVTGPESDPLALTALQEMTAMLHGEEEGGTDPRYRGQYSTHYCYVILDSSEDSCDSVWNSYFHGAESV